MLRDRLLAIAVLLPVGLVMIALGGWPYLVFLVLILCTAAWEYWRLFIHGGYHPSAPVIIGAVALLAITRGLFEFQWSDLILAAAVMVSMAWHVIAYQRGDETSGMDFAIDLGGILYLGWLGSYLISLRFMPNGAWRLLLALPAVWFADSAAYFIGRAFGKHKIAPRVSPGKSWEGYLAGVVFAIPGAGLLAMLWGIWNPELTFARGALLGLLLAAVTPLGDLGESLLKRQFGVKDSSRILPGHGGVLDRIDSWLWASAISYYIIHWFW